MISVVAKSYGIHPQTLRLYEREGLLKPSRTEGVEIILNMRRKMEQMQLEVSEFVSWVREELARAAQEGWQERLQEALVRLPPTPLARPVGEEPPPES
jgi:MerR family transcriptional regulator/heat shock protein HspR